MGHDRVTKAELQSMNEKTFYGKTTRRNPTPKWTPRNLTQMKNCSSMVSFVAFFSDKLKCLGVSWERVYDHGNDRCSVK